MFSYDPTRGELLSLWSQHSQYNRSRCARILRALEVLLDWTPADFDIVQAYLLGKAEPDQQYPVRYPNGEIREMFRVNGEETYALVVGNVYGLPTAGRTFAKERNRLLLEELPKRTGWKTSKLTREPCVYKIETENGIVYMLKSLLIGIWDRFDAQHM